MKQILCTMVAIFALAYSINAQTAFVSTTNGITNFKASIENHDLMVKWTSSNPDNANYWEVQGSTDGKQFSTIGMVLGADPKDATAFTFKQKVQKIKPGMTYFRVVFVEKDATAGVSDIIQSTK